METLRLEPAVLSVWLLLGVLSLVAAQREGFISIDCGSALNYTDDLGIEWKTDEPYTRSGRNMEVSAAIALIHGTKQLTNLRAFSNDRSKRCYYLPGTKDSPFLLRVSFLHGGFTSEATVGFAWSIDTTPVDTWAWDLDKFNELVTREYVFMATSNRISFCLIPVVGTMFINSLELRPLGMGMYDTDARGDTRFLKLLYRRACGRPPQDPQPDDVYDRIWPGFEGDTGLTSLVASKAVSVDLENNPPAPVMRTGLTHNGSFSLRFNISNYDFILSTEVYLSLAMADVVNDGLAPSFDLHLNGALAFSNLTLETPFKAYGLATIDKQNLTEPRVDFMFNQSRGSQAPPIVNAVEILSVRQAISWVTSALEVDALEVVKEDLGLGSWTGDPCVPVTFNWLTCTIRTVANESTSQVHKIDLTNFNISGTISPRIAELTALTELRLGNNNVTGEIPDLSELTKLRILQLQNNVLTGPIPQSLASLPALVELDVSNNDLSGPIPAALARNPNLEMSTEGNPNLCEATEDCPVILSPPTSPQPSPPVEAPSVNSKPAESSVNIGGIVGGIAGGVIALAVVIGMGWWCFCGRKSDPKADPKVPPFAAGSRGKSPAKPKARAALQAQNHAREFTLAEIQAATSGYRRMIGEGGYGPVYYGQLSDGAEVAVKVNAATSKQGHQEFMNEVGLLSRVHHRNLVSLLGYCDEKDQQILVYQYMPEGTLRQHLHGSDMRGRLSWVQRVEIALNAAKGLEYLHHEIAPRIIHRDVKSSNILLDGNLEAKVADFGICKIAGDDQATGVSTIVKGTKGYMDPEYSQLNRLTYKSDVYSFGVILLELLCGAPAIFHEPGSDIVHSLVDWARDHLKAADLDSIVDPILRGTCNQNSLWKMAEVAMDCVEPRGVHRPDIKQVIRELITVQEYETSQQTQNMMTEHMARSPGPGVSVLNGFHSSSTADSTQSSHARSHAVEADEERSDRRHGSFSWTSNPTPR